MTAPKPLYVVYRYGMAEYASNDLTSGLRHIGREVLGHSFGAMLVTTSAAHAAGFIIQRR